MESLEPIPGLPRRMSSSPMQLSTVLDETETSPPSSREVKSSRKSRSSEDLNSSRSTVPFPSDPAPSEHSHGESFLYLRDGINTNMYL